MIVDRYDPINLFETVPLKIGSETVASLNEHALELAKSLKVTRGRKLRVDSTVVEANVHPPTNSRLLGDGVRVISRLL